MQLVAWDCIMFTGGSRARLKASIAFLYLTSLRQNFSFSEVASPVLAASSTGFSYFFLARLGDWERARRRERELVAIEERVCRLRVSSPPHDSLRPSSLVNYYFMYYSRAGDWGRGSCLGAMKPNIPSLKAARKILIKSFLTALETLCPRFNFKHSRS